MQQVDQLVKYLLSGDQESSWEVVREQIYAGRTSLEMYEELFTASMRRIGELWENNMISVADEHLATSTCDFILSRYRFYKSESFKPKSSEKKALFLCVENEQHFLGLKMVSLLFEEHGWETRMLGANLPIEYAQKMAESWAPSVIGLSITIAYHSTSLSNYIHALEGIRSQPVVLLGGRLIPKMDFSSFCSPKTQMVPALEAVDEWLINYENKENINAAK